MKRDKRRAWIETPVSFSYPADVDWELYPGRCIRNTVEIRLTAYYNPDRVGVGVSGLLRLSVMGERVNSVLVKFFNLPEGHYPAKLKELKRWLENDLPNPLSIAWLQAQGFDWD
jgi:hypothetical protein